MLSNKLKTLFCVASLPIILISCGKPATIRYSELPPLDPSQIKDVVPKYEPKTSAGNPPTYVVFGKRYYLMNKNRGYIRRGIASWYGPKFHGRRTSNGEIYNMYDMTAAHKTLRIPSYVRVRNLENNRVIIARVNDRGPFIGNRVLDLSYAAAYKLGMLRKGTAFVQVEVIEPGETDLPMLAQKQKQESPYSVDHAESENALPLVSELPTFNTVRPIETESPDSKIESASTDRQNRLAITAPHQPRNTPAALDTEPAVRSNQQRMTESDTQPRANTDANAGNAINHKQPEIVKVAANPETIRVFIQLGAFKARWNAQKLYNRLWKLSYPYLKIKRSYSQRSQPLYRVRIGPLTRVHQVDRITADLTRNGFKRTRIVVE